MLPSCILANQRVAVSGLELWGGACCPTAVMEEGLSADVPNMRCMSRDCRRFHGVREANGAKISLARCAHVCVPAWTYGVSVNRVQFKVRQGRVKEGWRQLMLPNIIVDGNPGKRLMAACVKLYKDLLLLENFAIMNYCGFSKILKKHDKVTG